MHFLLFLFALLWVTPGMGRETVDELLNFSKRREEAKIVKVTDSDTVLLEDGRRVKMIGIESAGRPARKIAERDKNGNVIEVPQEAASPLEQQAIDYARSLLEGKTAKLEYDVESLDRNGYRQAYIFLPDGRLANAELIRQGFVHLKIRPPNLKYAETLRAAYVEASQEQRGFLSY